MGKLRNLRRRQKKISRGSLLPYRCPSCECWGHPNSKGELQGYAPRQPTEIHDCRFCKAIVCTHCYVKHNGAEHPELYRR